MTESSFSEKTAAAKKLFGTAAKLAQKQAELAALNNVTLPKLYHAIGKRIVGSDKLPADLEHHRQKIRQLESGRATPDQVLVTLRDSLDQLKLSIDAMNLPPGDVTALLANLRYRLEPRFAVSDIELQWAVELIEPVERLDTTAMRHLQFMLFEALSNVLQHAHASELRVAAESSGTGVVLRIIDNGRGFDISQPMRKGLASMTDRAQAIGARLEFASEPGRTVVSIFLD